MLLVTYPISSCSCSNFACAATCRTEEAGLLAHELERAEAEDASELDAALEDFQNWELDTAKSDEDDPAVLCPVCKARRQGLDNHNRPLITLYAALTQRCAGFHLQLPL